VRSNRRPGAMIRQLWQSMRRQSAPRDLRVGSRAVLRTTFVSWNSSHNRAAICTATARSRLARMAQHRAFVVRTNTQSSRRSNEACLPRYFVHLRCHMRSGSRQSHLTKYDTGAEQCILEWYSRTSSTSVPVSDAQAWAWADRNPTSPAIHLGSFYEGRAQRARLEPPIHPTLCLPSHFRRPACGRPIWMSC
jgi:hypothetical protein